MPSRIQLRFVLTASAVVLLGGQSLPRAAAQEVPDEQRKQVVEALGAPFIVFREKVLDELKVSDDQKEKLMQHLMAQIMETGPFLDTLAEAGQDREKKLEEHRKKAREKLAALLKEVLQPEQLKRSRQVTLQQEGSFALGQEDVRKELNITQEQVEKFMGVVKDLQKKVEPLIKEAQAGGKPEEIRPKVEQLRKDHGKKLEAILTDAQQKQWKELLGPPFELGD
jgi:preprotein translocase subunit SecD